MKTQRCEYCGRVAPVAGGKWPNGVEIGYNPTTSYARPESELSVDWVVDPFEDEIHHVEEWHWLCERCWRDSYWEI